MLRLLKHPHFRLLFTGTLFAAAFIWMAISSYGVDKEEIRVFLIMSALLIGVLIVAGCILGLTLVLIRKFRRKSGLLGKIAEIEKEVAESARTKDKDR